MINYHALTMALDKVISGFYEIIDLKMTGYGKGTEMKIEDIQVFPNIDGPDIFDSIFHVSGLTWMKKLDKALELHAEKKKKEKDGVDYRRMRLIMFLNNRQSKNVRLLINHNTQVVIRIWSGISDSDMKIREICNILSIQAVYGIHPEVVTEQVVGVAVYNHYQKWLDRAIDEGNERIHRLILKSIGLYDDGRPMKIRKGQKIVGRYGNKSVIAAIVPTDSLYDDIHHDSLYLEYKFKLINQMYRNNEIGLSEKRLEL
jgi:hypothetical protein